MIDWKGIDEAGATPGWIFPTEVLALSALAAELPILRARVLEIGCWCGKSTRALIAGMDGPVARRLDCVDNWVGIGADGCSNPIPPQDAKRQFLRMVGPWLWDGNGGNERQRSPVVHVYEGDYKKVLPDLPHDGYDMVFIDGPHMKSEAEPTFNLVMPLLKDWATLVIHDVTTEKCEAPTDMVRLFYSTGKFKPGPIIGTMGIMWRHPEVKSA